VQDQFESVDRVGVDEIASKEKGKLSFFTNAVEKNH